VFEQPEYFVTPEVVARFLSITRRRVLELCNVKGGIPSHPVPGRGKNKRKTYRFLISEVHQWMLRRKNG
jgi:hypothetical protein